ncbi:MAG TPA: TlpA disulfide reductase family protein [Pseudoxanthomonas sp.]
MKATTSRVLLVAVAAGGLGLLASLWFNGNPFWRTQVGERALHAATNATAPAPPAGVTPAGIGDAMPAIALPGLDGAIVDLRARYAGKRLLINVWASWCGPCIEEMPELDRFAASQGADGVQVIGLALDTPEGVRDFTANIPVRYPIVLDTPGPADASVWLGNAKGVLPYTVLVDADGRIARQKIGPFTHGEISGWVD